MALTPEARPLDAGRLLDDGPWSRYQKLLVAATASTIILDGVDNQLLPNAVPALIREWGQPRAAFTTALAIGPFGMMIGGLLGGMLGDRIGRRAALLASVLLFGVFTFAIAFADSIAALAVLRLLAGIGLGGAMPNAATLASEYVPARSRPVAVTLTIVSIPLGGALAGEIAALVIPAQGWRMLFTTCGALSILAGAVLWRVLPESPKFLARHPRRWPELVEVLRRSGHEVPAGIAFSGDRSAPEAGARLLRIFERGLALDTMAVSTAFFFGLMVNYIVVLLLPALLTTGDIGLPQPTASRALAMWNWGGVVAAVLGALAIQRIGSRRAMLLMALGAVCCGAALAVVPPDAGRVTWLLVMILLAGACVNGVQTTMYALAAHIFPTQMRGTGVGFAVAVGRVGNVLAAYAGAAAIDVAGAAGYFSVWAGFMLFVAAALACIRRHIPAAPKAFAGR